MFEQSVLSYGPAAKRVWTTFAGLAGEALLVACAVVAPLVWPQVLPRAQALAIGLLPPTPQAPRPPAPSPKFQPAVQHDRQIINGVLTEPVRMPPKAAVIEDPFEPTGNTVVGAVPGGQDNGSRVGILNSILSSAMSAPPAPRIPPPPVQPRPAPAEIQRVVVGGLVKAAVPVFRPEPAYPPMAKAARVSGTVEIEAVIGVNGRVIEARVLSGNVLLVRGALEAVRQWIYQPTLLNGVPVEVITRITVVFRLN